MTLTPEDLSRLTAFCDPNQLYGDRSLRLVAESIARLLAVLDAERATVQRLTEERDALAHGDRLTSAALQAFATDCSTPTYQLARNAVNCGNLPESRCRRCLACLAAQLAEAQQTIARLTQPRPVASGQPGPFDPTVIE